MAAELRVCDKYVLTIAEAAEYFHIGEQKLRRIISENPDANYWFQNGRAVLIKRVMFEKFVDTLEVI